MCVGDGTTMKQCSLNSDLKLLDTSIILDPIYVISIYLQSTIVLVTTWTVLVMIHLIVYLCFV